MIHIDEYKINLKKVLKDEEIIEEVSDIFFKSEKIKKWILNLSKDSNNAYEEKIENLKNKIKEYEDLLDFKEKELNKFKEKSETDNLKIKELESKAFEITKVETLYNNYKKLDGVVKEELSGIFKGDTLEDFIACGVQSKNISGIWDICKKSILNENLDSKEIVNIFEYFFQMFNKTYDDSLYTYINVNIKDRFNSDIHFALGRASGEIREVLLKGYKDRSGKAVKKSVVLL